MVREKGMTPKIPIQSEAGFKEFQTKDLILNEALYPRTGKKERQARSLANNLGTTRVDISRVLKNLSTKEKFN
jgi:hypothetical protein